MSVINSFGSHTDSLQKTLIICMYYMSHLLLLKEGFFTHVTLC